MTDKPNETVMVGVREHAEGYDVTLIESHYKLGRMTIQALNEAGHNGTEVDLLDLIAWLKANRPELLK